MCSFVRKVSSNGQISLYGRMYHLPKQYRATYVHIKFDPQQISWNIFDEHNKFITQIEAKNLTMENIRNLSVGQRTF